MRACRGHVHGRQSWTPPAGACSRGQVRRRRQPPQPQPSRNQHCEHPATAPPLQSKHSKGNLNRLTNRDSNRGCPGNTCSDEAPARTSGCTMNLLTKPSSKQQASCLPAHQAPPRQVGPRWLGGRCTSSPGRPTHPAIKRSPPRTSRTTTPTYNWFSPTMQSGRTSARRGLLTN